MYPIHRYLFRYGSLNQSPAETISLTKIKTSIELHKMSYQLVNNLLIRSYSNKFILKNVLSISFIDQMLFLQIFTQPMYHPSYKDLLRNIYHMNYQDTILQKVNQCFLDQCPLPELKPFFKRLNYQGKGVYAALSLLQTNNLTNQQQQIAIKFLTAIQLVNLGFQLHCLAGRNSNDKFTIFNFLTRIAIKIKTKQIKDGILVLAGDYFHIKASVLASSTQSVRLPCLLSELEIDLCKRVHLIEQLKTKILNEGYDKVKIQQIHNITILKLSPIIKSLIAMDMITGKTRQQIQQLHELYEIIGLLITYRKDLQYFMLNFKYILKKYQQSIISKIYFEPEESLPYYIFFQGAQNNQRLDTSLLNTDTLMKQKIIKLQNQLISKIGKQKTQQLEKKMKYFLMVYH